MGNIIACNLNSYRKYRDTAFEHLARIGLTNVELPCPEPGDVAGVQEALRQHGLTATSLIVRCQIGEGDAAKKFARALETVAGMGAGVVFTSIKAGDTEREVVYGRLREIGDAAARNGIVVAMETHPDLITNGDVALATMKAVDHPNIRVNFDTANVYYYNENVNAVAEFEKVVDYVGAVHLKDTNGAFKTWHFPALGEGVVDFPGIFERFAAKGADGPYTMELEGIEGEELTKEQVEARVEKSVQYLKDNGLMG